MAKTASDVKKVKAKLQIVQKKLAGLKKESQQKLKTLAAELKSKIAQAHAQAYEKGTADALKEIQKREQIRAKLLADAEKKFEKLVAKTAKKKKTTKPAKAAKTAKADKAVASEAVVKADKPAKAVKAVKGKRGRKPGVAKPAVQKVKAEKKVAVDNAKTKQRGRPRKSQSAVVALNDTVSMPMAGEEA